MDGQPQATRSVTHLPQIPDRFVVPVEPGSTGRRAGRSGRVRLHEIIEIHGVDPGIERSIDVTKIRVDSPSFAPARAD